MLLTFIVAVITSPTWTSVLSRTISILGVASAKDMFTDVVEILAAELTKLIILYFSFHEEKIPPSTAHV